MQRATSSKVRSPLSSPLTLLVPSPEQILRKGSSLLANAQLGPPTLCRQCALSQQNISKGKLRQRKRGPRMPKVQKENLMNSVVELGSVFSLNSQLCASFRREIQIVRPCSMCGQQKDSVPAIVVSREEIETNPAFAEFRAYRAQMENLAYRRSSRTGRKSSNCLSSSSQVRAVLPEAEYEFASLLFTLLH